jgi:catechol 2,3-dioxygenase-like lactoylglutathione lyase family enzyme
MIEEARHHRGTTLARLFTRRELARTFAGFAARAALRADQPGPPISGVDHIKLRVANSGASAMFYYGLFGGQIIAVSNSTLPDTAPVDEFFLRIGAPRFPYLMFAQVRADERPGLDHVSFLVSDLAAVRSTLERSGVSPIQSGYWFRDADGALIELMQAPTFGLQAQSIRVAPPVNLQAVRPAFEAAAVTRLCLRSVDVARSVDFFRKILGEPSAGTHSAGARAFACGATTLEIRPGLGTQSDGLDRIAIGIRGIGWARARRILEERGIRPRGSKNVILIRDPDDNETELFEV